ncbi:thioredoxin [Turicibacter sp. TJ11]|uniref:thioredoxin n=1 Tax=Turicibacter sp. TJ11 TaxID=2806443 RepID=UPI001F02280E|nr:thioredoxin [Turicibacter sp. TJ11]
MSVIYATEETFAQEISSGLVLVDFYADWCGPCKMIAPVLDELATELEGTVKIVKVNVDNCQSVAAEYKVMSIPTLILFKDGQAVQQTVGFQPKASLLSLIQSNK